MVRNIFNLNYYLEKPPLVTLKLIEALIYYSFENIIFFIIYNFYLIAF